MARVAFLARALPGRAVAGVVLGAAVVAAAQFALDCRIAPVAGFAPLASPSLRVAPALADKEARR